MSRTPLYDEHVKAGAKIVDFAGWDMPVRYSSFTTEHQAVRTSAGLFDVSHMGEIWVSGAGSEEAINSVTCNDVKKLYDGKAQYSALLNDQGGVIDDIIVYRFSPERFFICVNASNAEKDFQWISAKIGEKVEVNNVSADFGQIAIQGPGAVQIVKKLLGPALDPVKVFHFAEVMYKDIHCIAARTGYTGEDGFEIFCPDSRVAELWQAFIQAGVTPCGLGSRDTLRLEAALPLHGHELAEDISALESGLAWIVKFDKGDFIGKAALEKQKASGVKRQLAGFFISDEGIARAHDKVFDAAGKEIGFVTSGSKTPTVGKSLGMALIDSNIAPDGAQIFLEVRGRKLSAQTTKLPFYRRAKAQ